MKHGNRWRLIGAVGSLTLVIGLLGAAWIGGDAPPASAYEPVVNEKALEKKEPYSPYVGRAYPDRVLFGDTHFHTNQSFDAGLIGTTLGVDEAFRFARGEKVVSNTGQPVQLIRPLDFLVVTDHAEFLGLAQMVRASHPDLLAHPWGREIHDLFNSGPKGRAEAFRRIIISADGPNPWDDPDTFRTIWQDFLARAEAFDQPGTFSAMTGFEWTSTVQGNNLHRVVIFGDDADKTGQVLPFSQFDSEDPEDLWAYLAAYEAKTGGNAMAIPHNGNLSNGIMFGLTDLKGRPITKDYAERRIRWEPLHEMSQMKGDEEAHPLLSPDDEFADFETWDVSNITGTVPKTPEMLKYEYARSALKVGLALQAKVGVNPYQFGLMAATDTHTGLATSREENYFGKYQSTEPSPTRHDNEVIPAEDEALRVYTSQEAAAGLTAVWARNNTRKEIFAAMRRKEVYATTGTRLRVRVFGGWDFEAADLVAPDVTAKGYRRGVPMGGELRKAPAGKAPSFLVQALRDPDGANLDRIQVIKGWVDAEGKTHERIFDAAVSGGRTIDESGRCRTPVGSTVDVDKATWTNAIGAATLSAHWVDPAFDPKQAAFYYVRVLEIPTPRWTTYDAVKFKIERPKRVPATVQDRAYCSPIWYTP